MSSSTSDGQNLFRATNLAFYVFPLMNFADALNRVTGSFYVSDVLGIETIAHHVLRNGLPVIFVIKFIRTSEMCFS